LKKSLCFVDGEPNAYCSKKKKCFPLKLDYAETLDAVKSQIPHSGKRPNMIEIWRILAKVIPETETYTSMKLPKKFKQKTERNTNSFENRFTRDITAFLDTIFERGNCNKTSKKEYHYYPYSYEKAREVKLRNIKKGRKEYFY